MCTLTILRDEGRVLVTMNRDDLAGRPEAAPAEWPSAKPTFVAPKDLQAGGTWIGVHADGVIACLLNRYDRAPVGRTSRGSIVLEAMRNVSVDDACNALKALDHTAYSPFTCNLVGYDSSTRLDWTGAHLKHTDLLATGDIIMVTSSSWQFDEVKAPREGLFRRVWANGDAGADRIATFHSRRNSAHDAWAPMMQRPQSQTKSVTQVEVTAHGAEMRYWTRDAAIARQLAAPDASLRIPTSVHRDGRVQM